MISWKHYYDPSLDHMLGPCEHRCHCGHGFDTFPELTDHIRDVTLADALAKINAPVGKEFTGSAILDAFHNGKRKAYELVKEVR